MEGPSDDSRATSKTVRVYHYLSMFIDARTGEVVSSSSVLEYVLLLFAQSHPFPLTHLIHFLTQTLISEWG